MKFIVSLLALSTVSFTFVIAQAPVTQIEGYLEVYHPQDTTSVYIGRSTGRQLIGSTEKLNTFVGTSSGRLNTSGYSNSFFGQSAGEFNMTGHSNSFFGQFAGTNNTTGYRNSFFGQFAGVRNTTGYRNSFFGDWAGAQITTQSQMISIGANSGPLTTNNSDSMQLYIDVEQSNHPLIYGEFDNDLLRINGRLQTRVESSQKTYVGLFEESSNKLFGYEFEYDGAEDKLHLWSRGFSGNEAIRMTWLKNGKIGINKDNPTVALDVVGSINATGSINPSSDVNLKERFSNINTADVLKKVIDLPITKWQYKASPDRHIGPMAQDFYAAFGLGQGETTIATVDADGVALAAIKALAKENAVLKIENEEIKLRLARIEAMLNEK